MHPTRIIMLGGFLGAGKTTLIAHLLRRFADRGTRASVVTNDQAADLVDTALLGRLAEQQGGVGVGEVAGACFCCNFDIFIDVLQKLQQAFSPDLLIAEPVGSCTDIAATVLHPLQRMHGEDFKPSPFSVLVDPSRLRDAFSPPDQRPFPDDVAYIFHMQLDEADAILLNKIDQLPEAEVASLKSQIAEQYPNRPIFPVSALTGQGVDAWLAYALGNGPAATHAINVDYARYAQGEAQLAWLNATVEFNASRDMDWMALIAVILEHLRTNVPAIAHAKLFLSATTGTLAANLTSNTSRASINGHIPATARRVHSLINVRAATTPEILKLSVASALAGTEVPHSLPTVTAFAPAPPKPTHRG